MSPCALRGQHRRTFKHHRASLSLADNLPCPRGERHYRPLWVNADSTGKDTRIANVKVLSISHSELQIYDPLIEAISGHQVSALRVCCRQIDMTAIHNNPMHLFE